MLSSGLSGQCSRPLLWALQSITTAAARDPAKMQVSHTTPYSALQWLPTPDPILEKRPKFIQWSAGPPQVALLTSGVSSLIMPPCSFPSNHFGLLLFFEYMTLALEPLHCLSPQRAVCLALFRFAQTSLPQQGRLPDLTITNNFDMLYNLLFDHMSLFIDSLPC